MSNFLRASCSGAKIFFPLPNAIFSLGLSADELAVYAYLMYCEDRKSHQCWPSYKTIGRAVGMSENTVRKYVRELEYKTLILTEPTKYESENGQVCSGNLIFTILPIQGAVKYHNECQTSR
ncbi:helix-turn-helix domain-containing protein [Acutalibacter muris]|uniref:helix-turn-helix domain-containing protein n=1 Tax=Acutalibacter muris TaxID=1796620 RepID=UPI001C3EEACD|nr:helix-turn-helix domain-containing protein [Acutalibacter muris]